MKRELWFVSSSQVNLKGWLASVYPKGCGGAAQHYTATDTCQGDICVTPSTGFETQISVDTVVPTIFHLAEEKQKKKTGNTIAQIRFGWQRSY